MSALPMSSTSTSARETSVSTRATSVSTRSTSVSSRATSLSTLATKETHSSALATRTLTPTSSRVTSTSAASTRTPATSSASTSAALFHATSAPKKTTSAPEISPPATHRPTSTASQRSTASITSLSHALSLNLPTVSYTTLLVTQSNGFIVATSSPLPTSLSSEAPSQSNSTRVAIIAGATVAVIALLLILLALIFFYQRRRLQTIWDNIPSRGHGSGRRERKGLLDDEDIDDHLTRGRPGLGLRIYGGGRAASSKPGGRSMASPRNWAFGGIPSIVLPSSSPRSTSPVPSTHPAQISSIGTSSIPSLYRIRASESGSIFREEDVWPPPGEASEFADPFLGHARKINEEMTLTADVGNVFRVSESGHAPRPSELMKMVDQSGTSYGSLLSPPPPPPLSPYIPVSATSGITPQVQALRTQQGSKFKSTPLKSILKTASSSSGGSVDPSGNHPSGVGTENSDNLLSLDTPTTAPTASAHKIAHVAGNTQYQLHNRNDTVGTGRSNISESVYSTETADAAVELGYVTFGSTPPVLSPTPPLLPSHRRTYDNQSTFSSFYSQSSAAASATTMRTMRTMVTTRTGGSVYSQESAPRGGNVVDEFGQTSS